MGYPRARLDVRALSGHGRAVDQQARPPHGDGLEPGGEDAERLAALIQDDPDLLVGVIEVGLLESSGPSIFD